MKFPENSIFWQFADWHLQAMLSLGAICLPIIIVLSTHGYRVFFLFIICLLLLFFGQKLYESETTENWLVFSFFDSVKSIIGGILILFGWVIFLHDVLGNAIASLLLYLNETK